MPTFQKLRSEPRMPKSCCGNAIGSEQNGILNVIQAHEMTNLRKVLGELVLVSKQIAQSAKARNGDLIESPAFEGTRNVRSLESRQLISPKWKVNPQFLRKRGPSSGAPN